MACLEYIPVVKKKKMIQVLQWVGKIEKISKSKNSIYIGSGDKTQSVSSKNSQVKCVLLAYLFILVFFPIHIFIWWHKCI